MIRKHVFWACALLGAGALGAVTTAQASGFFDADQDALRSDVEHLSNVGLLDLPVSTWPLPVEEIRIALAKYADGDRLDLTDAGAVDRVLTRLNRIDTDDDDALSLAGVVHPTRFRENNALPREEGNLTAAGGRNYGRITVHLSGTLVTSPDDHQIFRLDGSYASIRAGNWLFSAGEMARSWGPSEHDSLILSTNARPIPAIGFDRQLSTAFKSKWLSWIGPWRFSMFLGTLDHARTDIRDPLFGGARITFKPTRNLEIGLSRTSQFCGRGRPCNFQTFRNLLLGNTNTNTSANVTAANDPGNDMAGFDARWVSPIGNLPYAVYGQMIGEDQQGGVPFKYLGQFGLDTWTETYHGGIFHFNLEYANTTCSFNSNPPNYGCAYHHYLFNKEGYRYKGFVLGSSWESDASVVSLNLRWVRPAGDEWQVHLHHGSLNRGGVSDSFNIEAPTKRDLTSGDAEYRWSLRRNEFRVGAGVDQLRDPAVSVTHSTPRFFAIWRRRI